MADSELTAGDEALRPALDAAMDGLAVLSDGRYRYANQSHADLYGYEDPAELVGRSWRSLYGETERDRLAEEALPALRETGSWRGEAVGRRRDGSTFPQEVSLTRTDDGLTVCTVRDISERRRHEEELERYERTLTNIHDAVYTLDPDGFITWVNEVAVERFDVGYEREELTGAHVSMLLSDEDIEKSLGLVRELVAEDPGGSRRCEVDILTAYGDEIPCDLHLALLPPENGEFAGTVGVLRDITERKRREERLSVLNRALRHNLRNDLNVALMRLEEAAETVEDPRLAEVREKIEAVTALGETARALDQRLERLDGRTRSLDLAALVREEAAAVRQRFPEATVRVTAPDACPARTDETLRLAVQNLIENAVVHTEAARAEVTVEAGGETRTVRVADDGPGIPEAELEALSGEEEPLEHGSGLGLWVATWCVDRAGGRLSFERRDTGTVATIRLGAP